MANLLSDVILIINPLQKKCCVIHRANSLPTNVITLIAKRGLNNWLHQCAVKLTVHSRDVTEAKHSVAAHVEVAMRGKSNAQILSVVPIGIVH